MKGFELLNVDADIRAKTIRDAMSRQFQFWDTQPVPKIGKFLFPRCYIIFLV